MLKSKFLLKPCEKLSIASFGEKIDHDNNFNIYFRDYVTLKNMQQVTRLVDYYSKKANYREPVKLHITSYGGDLEAAMFAYDQLKLSKIPIHTFAEGYVASAATIVFLAGKKRFMNTNSKMMIHQLSYNESGTLQKMTDCVQSYNMVMNDCVNIYLQETKMEKRFLNKILKRDVYLSSQECKVHGIIDEITRESRLHLVRCAS